MKKIISYHLFIILLLSSLPSFSQLNGAYTIGGSTPDYNTISDAVNDLNSLGISGAVTFQIRTGIYNEQVDINNVSGISPTNQITFESVTGNPIDVEITHAGTAFFSDSTDYINIKNITIIGNKSVYIRYGNYILMNNCIFETTVISSNHAVSVDYFSNLEISNCSIIAVGGISAGFGGNGNIIIKNCNIQTTGGSIAGSFTNGYFKMDSTYTSNSVSISTQNADSIVCLNNDLENLSITCSVNDTTRVQVKNNVLGTLDILRSGIANVKHNQVTQGTSITGQNSGSILCDSNDFNSLQVRTLDPQTTIAVRYNNLQSMNIRDATGAFIKNNFIRSSSTSFTFTGLNFLNCVSPIATNNRIHIASGSGIYITNTSGSITSHGIISNNFITVITPNTFYGITISQNCSYIDIINNSFFCSSQILSSAIFRAYFLSGTNNRILNNNCVINGSGNFYDYGVSAINFSHIDHNNLYYKDINNKTSYFPYHSSFCWNEGKKQSGFDLNSISVNPMYTNDSLLYNLNSALDSAGFNVGITSDIDGNSRNIQFPDIGATEFNKVFSPLSGVYSIGATGDFSTITTAVDSLEKVGGKDSVIFEIQPGIYTEEIYIQYIHEYSNDLLVKFVSTSSNVHDVSIETSSSSMLTLVDASPVWFENISFTSNNISSGNHLMTLEGDVNVSFNKCYFLYDPSGGYQEMVLFNKCNTYSNTNIFFNEDTIHSTNFVMNLKGNSTQKNHITISNCFINDNVGANNGPVELIKIDQFSNVNITKNEIKSYADAVIINSCNDSISISHNLIRTNTPWSSRSMLILNDCNTSNGNIYNNFMIPGSTLPNVVSYGIELFNSDSLNIMHNSIKGKHSVDISLFSSNSYTCNVYNNILMDSIKVLDSLHYFDYNNLKRIEYNGTNYGSNLPLFQSSTGTNLNSINQTPTFISTYDLHISNPWLRIGQAAPLVTNDIDHEGRHPAIPYIGADEFCQHPFSSFTTANTCNGDTTLLINNSTNLDSLNSLMWDVYADGSFEYTGPNPILFFFDSVGTYPVKIYSTNTNGCADSTIINITIGQDSTYNQAVSICQGDSISLYGIYQSTAGIYYDSLQTINGCDSTLSSTLSVNPLFSSNQNNAICQGDSLLIYGIYQNTTGTYYDSLQTINGCDSILSTTLAINSLPSVSIANFNPDTLCENVSAVTLPNGTPIGGIYSGNGVIGGNFDPSTAGVGVHNIIYTFTDGNSCINSDTTIITVNNCTSIDNINTDFGIIIYPNPSTGQFIIEKPRDLNKEVQIKLLDATSKLILEKNIPIGNKKIEMDIQNYSKGIYYLQLIVDDEIFVKQILKN